MTDPARDDLADTCLEWKDGILVYTGEIPPDLDIRRMIELDREQRMLSLETGEDQ